MAVFIVLSVMLALLIGLPMIGALIITLWKDRRPK